MKIKDPELYRLMKHFLTSYLPDTKQKSAHTILHTGTLLTCIWIFLESVRSIKLKNVCVSDFNQENISAFLKWLHEKRGNESTTINQRLSHIKGFCNMFKRRISCLLRLTAEYAKLQAYKDERVTGFYMACG